MLRVNAKPVGLQDALANLARVKDKVRKKATKDATSQATKIVLWEAKARVQVKEGLLRKALGRKTKVYRNTGAAVGIVGPRTGFKVVIGVRKSGKNAGKTVYANPTQYSHLVEKGTSHSKAYPFLGAALAAKKAACEQAMANVISNAIEDAAKGGS